MQRSKSQPISLDSWYCQPHITIINKNEIQTQERRFYTNFAVFEFKRLLHTLEHQLFGLLCNRSDEACPTRQLTWQGILFFWLIGEKGNKWVFGKTEGEGLESKRLLTSGNSYPQLLLLKYKILCIKSVLYKLKVTNEWDHSASSSFGTLHILEEIVFLSPT